MPEDKLLEELAETLTNTHHKKYVIAYVRDKANGLSTQFNEFVAADIHET